MASDTSCSDRVYAQLADAIDQACSILAACTHDRDPALGEALIELLRAAKDGTFDPRSVRNAEALQRTRDELHQREAFLATVAHELRNPITPVLLGIELLLTEIEAGGPLDRDRMHRRLKMIERQLSRLRSDLDRLLDFSRIRAGRLELQLEELDLAEVVDETVREMRPQLEAVGCQLHVSLETQRGRWDRMRLMQVVRNLLSNAAKYAPGSTVTVRVSGTVDTVVLTVSDSGPGIPDHEREHIFRRFERAGTQRQTGFGLGLWLVKNVVEALGGTIELASEVSAGTTFTITLPRSQ